MSTNIIEELRHIRMELAALRKEQRETREAVEALGLEMEVPLAMEPDEDADDDGEGWKHGR